MIRQTLSLNHNRGGIILTSSKIYFGQSIQKQCKNKKKQHIIYWTYLLIHIKQRKVVRSSVRTFFFVQSRTCPFFSQEFLFLPDPLFPLNFL